ncbi:MAG: hypothetical protein AAF611_21190 [Bacteroidota bacterium]
MVACIFLALLLILALVRISIRYDSKKSNAILQKQLVATEERKLDEKIKASKKNPSPYQYNYWDNIIDGSEMIEVDHSEISSQLLLDNWNIVANYYHVIKAEVAAIKTENIPEDDIFAHMSYPEKLMEDFYKRALVSAKDVLTAHFIKIHEKSELLRKPEAVTPLKVLDIVYSMYSDDQFYISVEPARTFYDQALSKHVSELDMKHTFSLAPSDVLSAILEELNVTYEDFIEIFPNTHGLFAQLATECWATAKSKTNSNILGFLMYGSGGIDYDLETGKRIDDAELEVYYENKGIYIEKDAEV